MSVTISGGGGVKSVQRGTLSFGSGVLDQVIIAPVNREKAVIEVTTRALQNSSTVNEPCQFWVTATFNDEFTVQFQRYQNAIADLQAIEWQVVEYA